MAVAHADLRRAAADAALAITCRTADVVQPPADENRQRWSPDRYRCVQRLSTVAGGCSGAAHHPRWRRQPAVIERRAGDDARMESAAAGIRDRVGGRAVRDDRGRTPWRHG